MVVRNSWWNSSSWGLQHYSCLFCLTLHKHKDITYPVCCGFPICLGIIEISGFLFKFQRWELLQWQTVVWAKADMGIDGTGSSLYSSDLFCGLGKRGKADTVGIQPKVLSFKCNSCEFPQQSRVMGIFLKWSTWWLWFLWYVPLLFLFLLRRMDDMWQETVVDLPVKMILYFVGFVIMETCDSTAGSCISQISLYFPLQTYSFVLQWAQRFLGKETQRQGENQTQRWQLRETQRQTQR